MNYRFLQNIQSPKDIKGLTDQEMAVLAEEIRSAIIAAVAENGGHLASNLGIVEATLALHKVFDCNEGADAFIFDVGHQAYAHKLLTGRFADFSTLRQSGGISGFTNRSESPFDTMTCGHSGSSVSAAMGIAEANRINSPGGDGEKWVVAIVGDGSFANGMIFEAINSLEGRQLKLIILLNDNEMSISKNVGGLSKYLSYIRTSEGYFTLKMILKRAFSSIPLIGKSLVEVSRNVKNFLKRVINSESLFENLGINYIGPVNGNDYRRMVIVLEEAKTKGVPVIVHIKTKKGMGYKPAEEHPERYHSASPFDIETGEVKELRDSRNNRTYTCAMSEILCRIAAKNDKICAITAAMTDGCGLTDFARDFDNRFFDVGIAEEHATALAGGLAMSGIIPVLVLYSTFSQRVFDQLWHDVCLQKAHVVIALSHSGLIPGDGVTHQGIYDVAMMKSLPNISVFSPDTAEELQKQFQIAVDGDGLCVVRYPKGEPPEYGNVSFTEYAGEGFRLKRASFVCTAVNKNTKLLVFTYGRIAVDAAAILQELSSDGISSELVVLEQILPLPLEHIRKIAGENRFTAAIVIEEGIKSGGIGESIASIIAENSVELSAENSVDDFAEIPVKILAIDNPQVPHGSLDSIKRAAAMDRASLTHRIKQYLQTTFTQY